MPEELDAPTPGPGAGRGHEFRVLALLTLVTILFWLAGPASPWSLASTSPAALAVLAACGFGAGILVARAGVASRRWLAGACVLAAALVAISLGFRSHAVNLDAVAARSTIDSAYRTMWADLEALADEMATDLGPVISEQGRSSLFDDLRERVVGAEHIPRLGVLLFDADGEAVSWYGAGLLQEPEAWELPASGRTYRRGFTASTALLVRPIGGERRPWRIVLGRSLVHDHFPFAALESPVLWSLGAPTSSPDGGTDGAADHRSQAGGVWRFAAVDADGSPGPALYVDPRPVAAPELEPHDYAAESKEEEERWGVAEALQRAALAVVALLTAACGLVAVTDRTSAAVLGPRVLAILSCQLGALGLAAATGARPWTLMTVGLASVAAAVSLAFDRPRRRGGDAALESTALWGLAVWGLFLVEMRLGGRGSGGGLPVDGVWLALSVAGVLLARWLAIAPTGERSPRFSWQFAAFAALGLGAALHDDLIFGLAGGLLGCAAVAWWWRSLSEEKTRPRRFAALALMAALAGSLAWQTAHREVLREVLEVQILPTLGPPESDELNELLIELHGFFDGLPLESVMPPPSAEVPDSTDLAYALWRRSPLTHHDGLSAVLIEDNLGQRHIFSFGLAFGAGLEPLPSPARWPVPEVPEWRDALIQGDARLTLDGRGWGRARFWYLPRPGFRRQVNELHELERNLVRGKPRQETADGLPEGVRYALYNGIGEARSSPWDEAPPLDADVVAGAPCGQRTTPDGDSWCWAYRAADGFETLYLPVLGPQQAIERVGAMAMWLFPWLVLLGAVAFAGAVRSAGVLELWRASTRSYSRRLALVFTLLLLVPLIALNLVLLRSVAERLRTEQLADARGAMVSARTLLLDYLRGLEPGFLIETQVNRELLDWIGGLVGHQVNLYWGSRLYASSQQELFTAGLLPRRIPGEIFTRLSLYGYDLGFRRQQTGDLAYLEVYAPVDVPGIVSSQQGLFLSVPLLEQEEAAARELAAMRSRAILFSSALLLLTLAVAGRLSRRFTEPIVQLIAGTRSIARGESYDPVKPRETELMALARAIDEMAAQVAASRRGLEREKHFVERVVDSITSAVVSLDRDRRVVLHNRVAEELLGTEIGTLLGDTLGQSDHFEPVLAFLEEAGPVPLRRQVKLRPAGERVDVFEWSLTWVPIPGSEDPAALLVVDDATEVMRGQRLETWAEMARIIAHEIKNPLTPIQLSTEHMQHAYKVDPDRFDDVLSRCAGNILRNVAELRQIASEFSTYSRIPAADLQPGDLVASIQLLVANYRDAPRGTEVAFASELDRLEVRFDERLIGRAVRNLVENALRETTDGGGEVRVEVDVERGDGVSRDFSGDAPPPEWAMVRVIDSGPGVDPQKLERIFEPYFSTYESGTGLGLAITRRIVEEHGGTIEARNRPGGGLAVIIRIPRTGENARPTLEADP